MGIVAGAGYALTFDRDPLPLYVIGRMLSATAGSLVVAVVILAARRTLSAGAALAGGALLAVAFLHVRDSHFLKPDALLSLTSFLALVAMAPLAKDPGYRRAAWAGVAVGVALATKYTAALLFVPLYAAAVMGSDARGFARLVPANAVLAGACALAFFFATSPALISSPASIAMIQNFLHVAFPSLVDASAAAPTAIADVPGPNGPEWAIGLGRLGVPAYHFAFSLRHGIGLLATLGVPFAVAWGLFSRKPLAVLSAIFVLVALAVTSAVPAMVARYMTWLIPAIALLEGGLLAAAAAPLARYGQAARVGAVTLGAAALVAEPLFASIANDRILGQTDTRVLATRWLADNVPANARVTILGTHFWPWGVPKLPPGTRYIDRAKVGAARGRDPIWVLTHDHVLYWSTLDPEDLERLGPNLELVASFDPAEGGAGTAGFELTDAWYAPFHGFGDIVRPGPHVQVYRLDRSPRR